MAGTVTLDWVTLSYVYTLLVQQTFTETWNVAGVHEVWRTQRRMKQHLP